MPRGPVCEPADEAWELLLNALHQIVRPGLALRIEPDWADEPSTRRWLLDQGLAEVDPVQPASTVLLDLRPSEDELLLGMKQKWRYNTRLAARRGVEVVAGDAGDVPEFGKLMTETGARDGFAPRPADYYADAKRAFGDAARLYLARRSGRTLAAIMVFHFGDTATYLYGASADQGRRHMPNHLLQWEAIRGAKRDGLRWYDFWGIPDELGRAAVAGTPLDEIPTGSGGLWGVWGFKRGFGGDVVRAVGAWDEVYSPTRYALGGALMRLRAAVQRHNPTGSA